jgi:hypothetical protein
LSLLFVCGVTVLQRGRLLLKSTWMVGVLCYQGGVLLVKFWMSVCVLASAHMAFCFANILDLQKCASALSFVLKIGDCNNIFIFTGLALGPVPFITFTTLHFPFLRASSLIAINKPNFASYSSPRTYNYLQLGISDWFSGELELCIAFVEKSLYSP